MLGSGTLNRKRKSSTNGPTVANTKKTCENMKENIPPADPESNNSRLKDAVRSVRLGFHRTISSAAGHFKVKYSTLVRGQLRRKTGVRGFGGGSELS